VIEALSYGFVQNALIAGILVSIASGIIGSLIVVNRMVFLAGGIAHTSYGGIGMAIYFGLPIFLGASIFAVLSALVIAFITLNHRHRMDTFIGLMWAVGMAMGVVLVDLTSGYSTDLMSYLFGSILAVAHQDIYYMGGLLVLVLSIIIFWYRDILAVSYDSEYAFSYSTLDHSCIYSRKVVQHFICDDDSIRSVLLHIYAGRSDNFIYL
jgi:zinc transport system permease protein